MGILGYAVLGHTVLGQPETGPIGGTAVTDDMAPTPPRLHVGDVVRLVAEIRDLDGHLVDPGALSLVIVHENGDEDDLTAALVHGAAGMFEVGYAPAITGRHLARFTATGDYAGMATVILDIDPPDLAFVTLADLRAYLGATSVTDAELTSALHAERAAQAQRCRVDPFTHELREALMRRVARNLAARSVPVATFTSFDGGATSTRVPSVDAEVRRLEGPYRKLTCG